MPQPIQATVYWDTANSRGTVDTISVPAGNGATVIQWSCDTKVISGFAITGLDPAVFNPAPPNPPAPPPPPSPNMVTNFTTTDSNNQAQSYTYNVFANHVTGLTSCHDPKIENGG